MEMKLLSDISNPAINPSIGTFGRLDAVKTLQLFLTNFLVLAFGVSGLIAFAMLLWGGLEYIIAGGDKERTQNASKKITSALIGLVLVFSIFAIISVIQLLFGIDLLHIKIPTI